MTDTLDLSKPVQTRDGRPARILCTDRKEPSSRLGQSIIYLVTNKRGGEECYSCRADGSFKHEEGESGLDLVNVKPSVWRNIYVDGDIGMECASRHRANSLPAPGSDRIAVLEITADGRAILHTDV